MLGFMVLAALKGKADGHNKQKKRDAFLQNTGINHAMF
jgi:hypothetical protein